MKVEGFTLAVLIPVRAKAGDTALQRCLASLLAARRQAPTWRRIDIVVIDDGSELPVDGVVQNHLLTEVTVIKNGRVAGQAGALNHGIQNVQADVYAFTDSDCVVNKDWFCALATAYSTAPHPDGVAGPNWLHQEDPGLWSQWLTRQESRLVQAIFCQYVDGRCRTTRFDCRNFSVTRSFLDRVIAPDSFFFVEGAGPSVSGLTSTRWRDQLRTVGNGVRFHAELQVRHEAVRSLREEARRYFRWGRNGRYSALYAAGFHSLAYAFLRHHFKRHFIDPILKGHVAPLYVWTVHAAYWTGIALEALETRAR